MADILKNQYPMVNTDSTSVETDQKTES